MRVEGLVFAGLGSADPAATARFLVDALGAEHATDGDVHRLTFANGSSLAVVPRDWVGGPSDTLLGFLVDDLDEATDELARLGIEPDGEALEGGGLRYRHFRGPEGRRFELIERRS
jgi:catechol 2,3-dioxygenase-like lactoylglutathione lyase family enzyme